MSHRKPGYHLREIDKGIYGEASKVMEEATEFIDAINQDCSVMAIIELSDLYGAMKGYLEKHHPSLNMHDLGKMSQITHRAFKNGQRISQNG